MTNQQQVKVPFWMQILLVLIIVLVIGKCKEGSSSSTGETRYNRSETDCVLRGVKYFESIGSYPELSDGRDAFKVATERCKRTTTAF